MPFATRSVTQEHHVTFPVRVAFHLQATKATLCISVENEVALHLV